MVSKVVSSYSDATTALAAINTAIDTIATSRAKLGASQNRLEFAGANIATQMENAEAARSTLMDLDVAAEMSIFTSNQILQQAGVSMLAQANQMPQNLLRLFR
jgi:flagellin